jgi:hypothetical protein
MVAARRAASTDRLQERRRFVMKKVDGKRIVVETDQPAPIAAYRDLKILAAAVNRYLQSEVGGVQAIFKPVLPAGPLMVSTHIGRADGYFYGPFHFTECRSQHRLADGFDRSGGSCGRFCGAMRPRYGEGVQPSSGVRRGRATAAKNGAWPLTQDGFPSSKWAGSWLLFSALL